MNFWQSMCSLELLSRYLERVDKRIALAVRQVAVTDECMSFTAFNTSALKTPSEAVRMERVQHMTRSAIRRASNIEVNPQTKRNLQDLIINFSLILICLLLIYIIVLLM
ncbi:Cardiac phospholamban [Anabarilius grahami]|nr:Cardiac phospholamban [Anabarilius grahami]